MKEDKVKIRRPPATVISPESLMLTPLPPPTLVAKKDFTISHNEYVRKIKAGEDISDVPSHYHDNLRTEGVL